MELRPHQPSPPLTFLPLHAATSLLSPPASSRRSTSTVVAPASLLVSPSSSTGTERVRVREREGVRVKEKEGRTAAAGGVPRPSLWAAAAGGHGPFAVVPPRHTRGNKAVGTEENRGAEWFPCFGPGSAASPSGKPRRRWGQHPARVRSAMEGQSARCSRPRWSVAAGKKEEEEEEEEEEERKEREKKGEAPAGGRHWANHRRSAGWPGGGPAVALAVGHRTPGSGEPGARGERRGSGLGRAWPSPASPFGLNFWVRNWVRPNKRKVRFRLAFILVFEGIFIFSFGLIY